MKKIIAIIGPTAVGKTYVSLELAKKLNTEIISADSMQIYKGMDIGTAKITDDEKSGILHHMIDIVNPDREYSVSEFKHEAEKIIDRLAAENKVPIIVGGAGLYVNSLIYDLDFGKVKSNKKIREYYTTSVSYTHLDVYKRQNICSSIPAQEEIWSLLKPSEGKRDRGPCIT